MHGLETQRKHNTTYYLCWGRLCKNMGSMIRSRVYCTCIYLESRHMCIVHVFTSNQQKVMSSLVNVSRYVSTANLSGFLRKNTTGT